MAASPTPNVEDPVFAIAEGVGVEAEIDIEGPDMRHVRVVQQQPGDGAANDGELAPIAAENLPYLEKGGFDCRGRAVVVVVGRLRVLGFHVDHLSLSRRRWSAASWPRSPETVKSR